ncbi:MAG TPA: helix-turn-helix domain-containing protein [Burkholderiaceae bacterium]
MDYRVEAVGQLRDQLRALRRNAGLTQAELGRRLGVSQARVAEMEGAPGSVSTERFLEILHALGSEMVLRAGEARPATMRSSPGPNEVSPGRRPAIDPRTAALARRRMADILGVGMAGASELVESLVSGRQPAASPSGTSLGEHFRPATFLAPESVDELRFWAGQVGVDAQDLAKFLQRAGVIPPRLEVNEGEW